MIVDEMSLPFAYLHAMLSDVMSDPSLWESPDFTNGPTLRTATHRNARPPTFQSQICPSFPRAQFLHLMLSWNRVQQRTYTPCRCPIRTVEELIRHNLRSQVVLASYTESVSCRAKRK